MERSDFLAGLRARLSEQRAPDAVIPEDWAIEVEAPIERFARELEAIHGHFHRAPADDVGAVVKEIVGGGDAPKVLIAPEPGVPEGVGQAVADAGGEVVSWPEDGRSGAARADFGVTSALWAVAETGTVLVSSAPPSGRAPSLLPPAFVCFVPAERVLPTLQELFRCVGEESTEASGLVLVTGPSKSSDIGMELTRGVHGPGEVHVVVTD